MERRLVTCGLCEGSGEQICADHSFITSGSLEPAEYAIPCPACDGTGKMEQEVNPIEMDDLPETQFSKPVMLCTCGKVLETPAAYAAHCAEAPNHFNKS